MMEITDYQTFIKQHKIQLLAAQIPEPYWETLHKKLSNEIFDIGDSFQLLQVEYDGKREPHQPVWILQATKHLNKHDSHNIYLVDHAWSYEVQHARKHLENEQLRDRMANILGIYNINDQSALIDEIFKEMWKVNHSYVVRNVNDSDEQEIWYVPDETGCAVIHNDEANCRLVPFFYQNQIMFSLIFLLDEIAEGDILYRDFAEGITDPLTRKALLLPWVPNTFDDTISTKPPPPTDDYYLSGYNLDILPDLNQFKNFNNDKKQNQFYYYSEYELITKYLTDQRFKLTTDRDQADILILTKHFCDYNELSKTPEKFVNQFPYEHILTVKDLLSLTCRKMDDKQQQFDWLPKTYNLKNELVYFVKYFQEQANDGDYWIIKPYNLARSMNIHITNNLNYILRLAHTGPKIAQRYLTNPVLFYRNECEGNVKFDLRYVILLKSVQPLKVYVYKQFFLRFANKPFSLDNFDDYEKHFTVMNYKESCQLKHLKCDQFKIEWMQQYENYPWQDVEEKILQMIRDIMVCATKDGAGVGSIPHSPQSRAIYAADLMLDWTDSAKTDIIPKILEINFMPDCQRACEYYNNFYNDIFRLLFLDEENNDVFFNL